MKKILLFLAAASFAVSCSGDDSSPTVNKEDLIGKWLFTRAWQGGQEYDLDNCESLTNLTYKTGGDLIFDEHYKSGTSCDNSVTNLDYTYDGNIITITNLTGGYDGGPKVTKYRVITLSSASLKVEAIYETDEVVPGHGPYEDAPYEGDIPQQYRWIDEYKKI